MLAVGVALLSLGTAHSSIGFQGRARLKNRRPHSGVATETEGLIDSRRLALMKRSAFLINISRGSVVDEDAIYAALRDGGIGGAALDVWWQYPDETEPDRRPSRHPFHELPNILMTPHCSG